MGKKDKPPAYNGDAPQLKQKGVGDRGNWGTQLDFILTCIGFAVGLGNVWRFPYLCFRNGGGAFLVPYVVMLAIAGLPLFFLELGIGQHSNYGVLAAWKLSPAFRGLGWCSLVITWLTAIYYNVIIMWTIFYLFASIAPEVPWKYCGNAWNTANCYRREITEAEKACVAGGATNCTVRVLTGNETSPSLEYYERYMLGLSDGIDNLGNIRWQLAVCLVLAWLIVFICLIKGVKSAGKVVYFTALFPYVVLIALLIRGATLPGAADGIKFYMIPSLEKLRDPVVWKDAASQIFYSLGPGWGGLITFASYNKFNTNCCRDAVIVSVVNCGTSVFAGFAIFSMIGFMAHELGQDITSLATSGPGLAFVVYPEGIARMPLSPLWGVIFFSMLLTLGLDSQFTMLETVITAIVDAYPRQLRPHKSLVTLGTCIVTCVAGLACVCNGGAYVLNLMDWFIGAPSLLFIGFFEPIVICYCYGVWRFCDEIKTMIGFKPNYYWLACWTVVTPISLIYIVVMSAIHYTPPYYGKYIYPKHAEVTGWILGVVSLVFIPIFFLVTFFSEITTLQSLRDFCQGRTARKVLRNMFLPPKNWGPAIGNDYLIDGVTPTEQYLQRKTEKEKDQALEESQTKYTAYTNPTFDPLPANLY